MQTQDLIDAWLAARQQRNLDRLASLAAAHAVWHSPVEGPQVGRSAVVDEVRRGYANTDSFENHLLDVECHDVTSATARIRNIATRQGKHLDSVQTLYVRVARSTVHSIHGLAMVGSRHLPSAEGQIVKVADGGGVSDGRERRCALLWCPPSGSSVR